MNFVRDHGEGDRPVPGRDLQAINSTNGAEGPAQVLPESGAPQLWEFEPTQALTPPQPRKTTGDCSRANNPPRKKQQKITGGVFQGAPRTAGRKQHNRGRRGENEPAGAFFLSAPPCWCGSPAMGAFCVKCWLGGPGRETGTFPFYRMCRVIRWGWPV